MNLMEDYEVVEVLEPEILTDLPDENFDTFTVYDLSFNGSLPSNNPDYFVCKNFYLNFNVANICQQKCIKFSEVHHIFKNTKIDTQKNIFLNFISTRRVK